MNIDILLYIDNKINDEDLFLGDNFIPESISERLKKIERVGNIYYSTPSGYKGKLSEISKNRDGIDDVIFWKNFLKENSSDHIIKIFADSPFIDITIIEEMLDIHLQYLAEFTFSENLPEGFNADIISKELINDLPEIKEETLPLDKVIKSNINDFDVELFYKDPDIRDKRISFRSSNKRDKLIMENIIQHNKEIPEYTKIKSLLDQNPELLFIPAPSYLEIELTGKCSLDCIFCYRKNLTCIHENINPELIQKIISEMNNFEVPYTISFSGAGEPMEHPGFYNILESCIGENFIEQIIIETNGLYIDDTYINLISEKGKGKIKTIVNMNGYNQESYKSIHGHDHFEKIFDNILKLNKIQEDKKNNDPILYVQLMKINETEPFVDKYYDFWEKNKIEIIFQKQNIYNGKIEDRRYSDLSPVERNFCFHLLRDLYINSNGVVSYCKQDIDRSASRGDLNTETILSIREKMCADFVNNYSSKYPENPNCSNCDEWYTFNF